MNKHRPTATISDRTGDHDLGRRDLLKLAGAGAAVLGMTSFLNIPFAEAQTVV
jgi:hypothetical protein